MAEPQPGLNGASVLTMLLDKALARRGIRSGLHHFVLLMTHLPTAVLGTTVWRGYCFVFGAYAVAGCHVCTVLVFVCKSHTFLICTLLWFLYLSFSSSCTCLWTTTCAASGWPHGCTQMYATCITGTLQERVQVSYTHSSYIITSCFLSYIYVYLTRPNVTWHYL